MKRFSLLQIGVLAAVAVSLVPLPTRADEYDKKTTVTFSQPTEAPGIILQPGKYVIKLLNSSSNRHIVEIMNERMDHLYALTFTANAEKVTRSGKTVLTFYEGVNGQPQALRRWFWPGEVTGQEFLYPKDQAARIALATHQKVAEGGLPTVAESNQSLTPDNANGFTVQAHNEEQNESKPAAAPVTANAVEPAPAAAPIVIAQATPPPPPVVTRSDDNTPEPSPAVTASNTSLSDTTLPQTASDLPLVAALGFASLGLAIVVASVRRYRSI